MSALVRLPAFLVGMVAAVAAEVAVGLLLYTGPGFLRALTLILATLLGGLSLGLWTRAADASLDGMRRRWLLALLCFVAAALTAGGWGLLGGLSGGPLSRGFGLAFLAGLPLYGSGAVLTALSVGDRSGRGPSVGAAAALGAAVGILLTGVLLVRVVDPANAFVLCLVLLSGAALVHGRVLEGSDEVRVLDEATSPWGTVRVEEVRWGSRRGVPGRVERRLRVGDVVRGAVDDEGRPTRAWEEAARELLAGPASSVGSPVLVLGAGAVGLMEALLASGRPVDVVEPNGTVWRMVLRHFGFPRNDPGVRRIDALPSRALREAGGGYGAVVVDGAVLAPGDAFPLPSPDLLARALGSLEPGGRVLLGGRGADPLLDPEGRALIAALVRELGVPEPVAWAGEEGALLVLAREPGLPPAAHPPAALGVLSLHPLDPAPAAT